MLFKDKLELFIDIFCDILHNFLSFFFFLKKKTSVDPFEVYLIITVEDGTILLPENLYNCDQSSTISFHELQIELRNLDIYMGTLA